jgi:NitT/TauT family transport system permease protein/taurine transport system permease protein
MSGWRPIDQPRCKDATLVVNITESRAAAEQPVRVRRSWLSSRATRSVLLSGASVLVALLIWQFLSTFVFNPFLVPPPLEVFRTAIPMLLSGEILQDVAISMARVMVGFVTGSLSGIVVGVLLGRIRVLHDLFDPIVELLRYLSPTAMIPIAVIWFGIGEMSKYFLIFWGTFFIVVINSTVGVWRAPVARQRAAECLGANALQIFLLIVIPSAVPYIVTGMRVAMASSFMSIIPAEILAADSGIGYLLQKSSMLLQTNRIFVALLTICVLGFVVDRIFRFFVDRVLARYMSFVSQT